MKKMYKIAFHTLTLFILSSAAITIWYLLTIGNSLSNVHFEIVKNIFLNYGLTGAGIIASFFLAIRILFQKIMNRWVLVLSTILLVVLFVWVVFLFFWYFVVTGFTDNPFLK